MVNFRIFIGVFVFLVTSFTFSFGLAVADPLCTPRCDLYPICDYQDPLANFEYFNASPNNFMDGAVCHPNTNFKIYVTTSAYGNTTSLYQIISLSGAYVGTFVSGHPHYKIVLADEFDPSTTSFSAVQLKFSFRNDQANMKPIIDIDVFDVNDNNIHTDSVQTSITYAVGTSFEVSTFFIIPSMSSQASYIHINTNGHKFGLISVEFIGM